MIRCISSNGFIQLSLMWRRIEPSFGVGTGRHLKPYSLGANV
jgi:hypothetical protein